MTNPTLLTQDTAWRGWTGTEFLDEILRPFGLTNDNTTTRVVASTDEQALARDALRLATTYLFTQFPNVWAKRVYSVTWTADDHSKMLPANVKYVERVFFDGSPVEPITLEDYTRFVQSDTLGGGYKSQYRANQLFYFISGIADADTTANGGGNTGTPDWRMVLQLAPTPEEAKTLTVHYICKSPDFASADDADYLELDTLFHDWIVNRAAEILCTKLGAARSVLELVQNERMKIEADIFNHLEGTGEMPTRVRWEYPRMPENRRR